jgi:G3E family GTPase
MMMMMMMMIDDLCSCLRIKHMFIISMFCILLFFYFCQIKEELRAKMLEVARKREATDKLLDMMGTKKEEAEAQASMADKERDKADLAAREAGKLESQATSDLESAKPALEAARAALGQLDKAMLVELKGFSKLPTGVDKVDTYI